MSCIERCPHFQEPLYCGHLGDLVNVLNRAHYRGEFTCLGRSKVSLIQRYSNFQGSPLRGVPLIAGWVMGKVKGHSLAALETWYRLASNLSTNLLTTD